MSTSPGSESYLNKCDESASSMGTHSFRVSSHDSTSIPGSWKQLTDSVFEVYKPTRGCISMDIVFFHGFQAKDRNDAYYSTWMKGDDSGCWLDTWLVECFPQARILSVSYDSSLTSSSSTGRQDMYLLRENLAQSLIELVGVGQCCPVVLVGHCLGGLVLKEICLLAENFATHEKNSGIFPHPYLNFLKYVKGAFFYSTPNLGSHIPVRSESGNGGPLLEHLVLLSAKSSRINAEFSTLRHQRGWKTFGVGEGNETRMLTLLPYLDEIASSHHEIMEAIPEAVSVVDEASARADMDRFCIIPGVDHFTICKPHRRFSMSFSLLVKVLENICEKEEEREAQLQFSLGFHLRVKDLDHRVDRVIEILQMQKAEPIRLAVVGMDGIGKSTLVKQVLAAIQLQFHYTCFVEFEEVHQSRNHRELDRLVAQNLWNQNGRKLRLTNEESPWLLLKGQKVLMIVEDVESEDQISPLLISSWCGEGSRLIITSSRQNWSPDFIVHEVPLLSKAASLELLQAHVEEKVLRSIPKELVSQVVDECDGLPLTLEVIGRYLRDKTQVSVWSGALKRLQTADSLDGHPDNVVWKKLRVSFDSLAELEKKIFLDIATFDLYGPSRKHYDLNIFRTAWGVGYDEQFIDVGLVNLYQMSLLRIDGTSRSQESTHIQSFLRGHQVQTFSLTIHLHKQLRDMGKWISRPLDKNPIYCRSLWLLKDVKSMLLTECKGEKPETQVLSVAMEQKKSGVGSQCLDAGFPIRWSSIGSLEVLRLLRISNMHTIGYENYLTFPVNLALLHMQNCKQAPHRKRKSWMRWLYSPAWPVREEDVASLDALSVLILENCSPVHLPKNVHMLHRLKILQIHGDRFPIEPLPEKIGLLPVLEHLSLNVSLKKLPNSLLQLQSLQSFVLSGGIEAWPTPTWVDPCSHLTSLTMLKLVNLPALSELPDTFGGLKALRHLSVVRCSALTKLPEGFAGLQQLQTLDIIDCDRLEMLCESFPTLPKLEKLQLFILPALRKLPTTFGQLPALQKLRLHFCYTIKELPASFVDLQSIRKLSISSCDALESLWPVPEQRRIGHGLRNLLDVRIESCRKFQGLPEALEQLESLKVLKVLHCERFMYVPESLRQLTSLETMEVCVCRSVVMHIDGGVRVSAGSVGQISGHRVLTLTNCETLPTPVGQLSSLRALCVNGSKVFMGVPDSVARLTAWERLDIGNFQTFSSLLKSLGHLTSLATLIIRDCQDLVSLPESVGQLSSLRELYIQNCENFVSLPKSFGQLTALEVLTIENCRNLATLPDAICRMTSLVDLCILDCKPFDSMLGDLGLLTKLSTLYLSSWSDLSPLLASLRRLRTIRNLLIKCMTCENNLLSVKELDSRILTRIDECCGCIHVMDFLKSIERFLLCKHPLEISLREEWYDPLLTDIIFHVKGHQGLALRVKLVCGRKMDSELFSWNIKICDFLTL